MTVTTTNGSTGTPHMIGTAYGAKFPAAIPFEKTARYLIKAECPIAGLPKELIVRGP